MDKNQPGIRQNYPKDLLRNLPPKQEGKMLKNPKFSAFALSLPGASHIRKGVPCQDYSDIRILEGCGIIIAGIADGVGSCPLSHWGAYIAVNEALGYVESQILRQEAMLGERELCGILNQAFRHAEDMVAGAADAAGQAVRNLQSTLTVAVYDGSNLYCCHVGDDGVVAQQRDGTVKLATNRLKGEEASSVYPLQTGRWAITKTENAVAGFVMATDGILDAFALISPDYTNRNYFNHIYYPFMEPAMYEMLDRSVPDAVGKTLDFYRNYLNSSGYREKVTDDLTLIAVAAPAVLAKSVRPEFSKDIWNEIERENEQKKAEALGYSSPVRKQERNALPETVPAYPKTGNTMRQTPPPRPPEIPIRQPIPYAGDPVRGSRNLEAGKEKKKSRKRLDRDETSLLLVGAGILIAVLIIIIAVLGFLYYKKYSEMTETTGTAETREWETMEMQTAPSAENGQGLKTVIKASGSDASPEFWGAENKVTNEE